ncbi:MAG: VPLPA-CTERM sorting domain-containing protein [Thiotrichales bacterium]|nr:MAG: VPLPA-CTERM sorting domain-containing protein [Thiotrichales bacterium]
MNFDTKKHSALPGKALIKLMLFGAAFISMSIANAASVTGDMGITGAFTASGGTDLSDHTSLDLTSATGTGGSGAIGGTVGFGTVGTVFNSPFTFNPSTPVSNLLQIGNWQVDLATTTIDDQTVDVLTLSGTGTISGNGFDLTPTTWTLSANATGGSYSMTVNAVPVPAAVWLFGSGLIGLIAVARRKAS